MLQARVIEIYEKAGFANLALEAKKEYVARYGIAQRVPPRQPRGLGARRSRWSRRTSPSWRATITRSAQKSKASADYQEAVRWYRAYLVSFPTDPAGGAEQLPARRAAVRGQALRRRRASSTRRPPTATRRMRRAPTPATPRCSATRSSRRSAPPAELPALQRTERRQRAALRARPSRPTRAPARC